MKDILKNVNYQLFVISMFVFAYGLEKLAAQHNAAGDYINCAHGGKADAAARKCEMSQSAAWLYTIAGAIGLCYSFIQPILQDSKILRR